MHAQRITALTALAAASALVMTGCAGGSAAPAADVTAEPEYSGTLSILTKFGGDPLGPYFETLAAEYEELHPEVTVELIQETDQSVKDKTKTLTASGALPDIYFTWTGNWAQNFIDGGLAADLTDVIGPDTEWGQTFGEASLSAFEVDGKYFGIPLYNNGKFMGYNTAIFDEVGIEVPTTFEELIESCAPLREAGYEPIAFGNKDGWPALHYLQQLFAYNVPSDVLHDDFSPATATLDDAGYVASLEQFKTLVDECTDTGTGTNGVLYTTAQEALAGGRAAMYYQEILEFDTVTAEGNALTPENFGIFPLPVPERRQGRAGRDRGIARGIPHQREVASGRARRRLHEVRHDARERHDPLVAALRPAQHRRRRRDTRDLERRRVRRHHEGERGIRARHLARHRHGARGRRRMARRRRGPHQRRLDARGSA